MTLVLFLLFLLVGAGARIPTSISGNSHSHILQHENVVIPVTNWTLSTSPEEEDNAPRFRVTNVMETGDILSILMEAGTLKDPYYDRNFLTQRHIWVGDNGNSSSGNTDGANETLQWTALWTYATFFTIPKTEPSPSEVMTWKVVLEGAKMGAEIFVNKVKVGEGEYTTGSWQ
jgi:hypothetical protein